MAKDEEQGDEESIDMPPQARQAVANVVNNALNDIVSSSRFGRRSNRWMYDETEGKHLRDLEKILDYPDQIELDDLHAFYERDPLAGAIVDKAPNDSWKEKPDVFRVDEDGERVEDDEFNDQVESLIRDKGVISDLKRADKLQRLGEYGIIFMGLSDAEGEEDQARPVEEELDTLDDLLYLQPYAQRDVEIEERFTDDTDRRFGEPKFYEIEVFPESVDDDNNPEGDDSRKIMVHRDRVIHIVEKPGTSETRGRPVLRRIYNRLIDKVKTVGPAAESLYQVIAPKWWLNGKSDQEGVDSDLESRWKQFVNNIRDAIATGGVEDIKRLGGDEVDPSAVYETILKDIATDEDVPPLRILMGNQTGERASTQDRRLWFGERIPERVQNHCEPKIFRPLIDKLQNFGILPNVSYDFEWPSLFELTELEKAERNKNIASAIKSVSPGGQTDLIFSDAELRDAGGVDDELIEEQQEEEGEEEPTLEEEDEIAENFLLQENGHPH